MATRPRLKTKTSARSNRKRSRFQLKKFIPKASTRKRWFKRFRRAPAGLQIFLGFSALVVLWLAVNWIYQVVRKPSELWFPVSGVLYRVPAETWKTYESAFRKHSTAVMTPEFLAALAQVEGSGNPIVRTYWRFSLRKAEPFEVYRPASSAVGMYQITDGTFALARRYCVHDHVVVEDGPWNDLHSCWFNWLYARVLASNAIEMTSAYLDRQVAQTLAENRITRATLPQKQELATLIHLCGAGAGNIYARRGLRLAPGQKCGDHDARSYIARVNAMKRVFARLSEQD
ncbi:MAG TPA: hypothetical protein VFS47_13000 [Steroidobacteraceae bacterium]|nr:hypothetical protein [Steroidobacteraceae bacterium]